MINCLCSAFYSHQETRTTYSPRLTFQWQVQLRAKLVVLSCHSVLGKIKAEGPVGIVRRAFLRSGVRSVRVSLWTQEGSLTEQCMSNLYDHLVRGESASDSHYHHHQLHLFVPI